MPRPSLIGRLVGALALALTTSLYAQTPSTGTSAPSIVVRGGDVLRLKLWPDQTYSGDYPVEPSGQVFLPLLGEVVAGGRSLEAVRGDLQARYRALVQNSTVAASVIFRVSVLGSVVRPGLYQVDPSTSVLDAISLAGGLRDDADGARLRLLRGNQSIDINATTALAGDQTELMLQVQSGDRIIVPQRPEPRITTQGVLTIVQTVLAVAILALQLRN